MTEIKKEVRVILKRKGRPLKQQGDGSFRVQCWLPRWWRALFKSKPLTTPEIVCQTWDLFLYEEKVSSLPCFFLLGHSFLVTRLHNVKISFFAVKSREFIWIKESKKKREMFSSMSSTSSQELKKKKNIFIDVITYRVLTSVPFLASSLYLCLWFWRSVSIDFLFQSKGIAWTDNLETKAFSLSLFFWDWDLAFGIMLTIPFD